MPPLKHPALSTMWLQLRYDTIPQFIAAAHALGFDRVELGHVVTEEMLKGISRPALGLVSSLHHPCPNPGGVPELSDVDEDRRSEALAAAKRTIEWANRLEVPLVILHLGQVGVDRRWENALRARWLQGEREEPNVLSLTGLIEGLRASELPRHRDAARRSLTQLLRIAERNGVRLALENGEWVSAMPSLEDAELLLAEFNTPSLGLWVDTGHATILERLGFGTLHEWLALAPSRVMGLHYHDVNGLRDHLIPGRGTINWEGLAPLVPAHALPTCEFDWYYSPEEILSGVQHLARHGLVEWGPRPNL